MFKYDQRCEVDITLLPSDGLPGTNALSCISTMKVP